MKSNSVVYFKNLDSIRFIAALMVLLQHGFMASYAYLPIKDTWIEKLLMLISNGGTGVSIFFVLSGFLITYLLISEYELNNTISVKKFYLRRFFRIWPLYFLVVIFSFLLYPFAKSFIWIDHPLCSNVFYHIAFLSNFDVINILKNCNGSDALSQNITWSVSIEEQFYLFWPLLFAFLPKKTWIFSIITVVAVSILFRIIHYDDNIVLYFHTLSVLLDLGIGGLTAYAIKESNRVRLFFMNTSTSFHLFFLSIAFCMLFWFDDIFSFKYGPAISRIFISSSFACIIAAQAMTTSSSVLNLGRLSFANRWGKYTYGIYLLHPIAIIIVDVLFRVLHISMTDFTSLFLKGVLSLCLTFFISKISYTYFEMVFLRLKTTFEIVKTDR